MKIITLSFLTLLALVACKPDKKCPEIDKPIDHIKAISDLSQRLHDDILEIAYADYRDGLEESTDTIDIHKREIAYQLYETASLTNALSYQLQIAVFSHSNDLTREQQDTASYEYILNYYTRPFATSILNDTIIKNKFLRLQDCQEKVIRIKEDIIKTETGKGHIICRDLGPKLSLTNFNSVSDYWDLLYLIENSHYIICKDILCTFSNLSCYKTEIRWKFWTRYSGNPDETIRRTKELKKR
jgi:hypothetical protein